MSKNDRVTIPTSEPSERRGPGRPRKVVRAPSEDELVRHERELGRRDAAEAHDDVVHVCGPRRADPVTILECLVLEAARECARLKFQRREAQKRGQDIQRLASRRIAALMALVGLIPLLHLARNGQPSVKQMQRVVALLLEEVATVAHAVLPTETADTFLGRLGESLTESPPDYERDY